MKKQNTIKTAALFSIALCITACSTSDDSADNWNGEIRLSSGLTVETESRAASDLYSSTFSGGEKVAVNIAEVDAYKDTKTSYPQPITYTVSTNDNMSLINPTSEGATYTPYYPSSGNMVNIFAAYPATSISSEDKSFTVQTDQSTDADYKASDLLFAYSEDVKRTSNAVNLEFEHQLSKVTIVLNQGDGKPDLDGAKVELLSVMPSIGVNIYVPLFSMGDANYSTDEVEYEIGKASGEAKSITVFTATSTSLKGSCIVPPQELGTEFVKVTLKNGGELYGSLASGKPELKSGNAYTYTITVSLTGLDITSSISKWGSGEGGDISASMVKPKTNNLSELTADELTDDYIAALIKDGKLTIVGEYDQAKLAKISAYVRAGNSKSPAVTTLDISAVTGLTGVYYGDNQTNFYGSNSLTTAILPTSVTNINYAFQYCTALTTVKGVDNVKNADGAFYGCSSMTEAPNMPNAIYLGGTFSETAITSLSADNVETFNISYCANLTEVTLTNLKRLDPGLFGSNLPNLTTIRILSDKFDYIKVDMKYNYDAFCNFENKSNCTLYLNDSQSSKIDNQGHWRPDGITGSGSSDPYIDLSGFQAVYCGSNCVYGTPKTDE